MVPEISLALEGLAGPGATRRPAQAAQPRPAMAVIGLS